MGLTSFSLRVRLCLCLCVSACSSVRDGSGATVCKGPLLLHPAPVVAPNPQLHPIPPVAANPSRLI